MLRTLLVSAVFLFLVACDDGDSDSGANVETTAPGDMFPASFAGVYSGNLNLTASAAGITQSDSFPITITVNEDATIRFDGDDPDETFTVGVQNDGTFSGSLSINEDPCSGTVSVTGRVDGTNASGNVSGSGNCTQAAVSVDVELSGDFTATKG